MPSSRTSLVRLVALLAIAAVLATVFANHRFARLEVRHKAEALTGGRAEQGQALFVNVGCGGCHTVRGVPQATGLVGPPLDGIGQRAVIAGMLANTPDNLERWISAPQSVVPGNAMPDLPMTAQQTRDIAAFLYTQ